MADNISITQGTGTTVATDDVGGVQYQKVKLVDGTADQSTVISAGGGVEANALRVTIASDSTGVVSVDDNGGSLTVDNAGLTSLNSAISGTEVQVDIVGSLPAGTNAIGKLAANDGVDIGNVDVASVTGNVTVVQPTGTNLHTVVDSGTITTVTSITNVVHIDDNSSTVSIDDGAGSITIDNADITTIAGAVSGTEMQVDIVASLPAGTNAIGKLSSNDGVDIGNVDVASIAAGDNNIGNVDIASAIPAGSNIIGKVSIDQVTANANEVVVKSGTVTAVTSITNAVAVTNADITSTKTAVELIDNAVDGNYLNVNLNIAGTDVDGNSGNKSANTQRVCVATDDVNLSAIKTAVELIDNTVGAISGSGSPTIDSYATVAINLTTGANQVLVSSAANKQIWVYGYAFSCGDAAGQTVSLQDEDDTAITGIMEFAQYGGIAISPSGNFSMPVFKLATDKDLEIDITGGDVDGWLSYAIVSV